MEAVSVPMGVLPEDDASIRPPVLPTEQEFGGLFGG